MTYLKNNSVLGIGNALVDILVRMDNDRMLEKHGLPKGSMQLIEEGFQHKLIMELKESAQNQASGGSAANTIHGLAKLGVSTGFIGSVGNDPLGDFFVSDLKSNQIDPKIFRGKQPTGTSISMISPDSERTMATFLGAAIELVPELLQEEMVKGYGVLYMEGYLVQNRELVLRAIEFARKNSMKIAIDLASYNIVEYYRPFFKEILDSHVDIVFANESEAETLTGQKAEDAVHTLAETCEIAVVKIGKEGSLIKQNNEFCRVEAIPTNSIDTTGAGDLYAAGFIFGLTKGYSLEKCGEAGSLVAGKVIETIGAKIPDRDWEEIYTRL